MGSGLSVLFNNAATGRNPGQPWENGEGWEALLGVNLMGVLHGVQAFAPAMVAGEGPGVIVNTGSKQGITSPPGNPAYNLSKAGVRSYTESLSHGLREATGGRVSAHLLIPGFTYTGMTNRAERPAAAWTAEQVADFALGGIGQGDFYILCPDNDVDRATARPTKSACAGQWTTSSPTVRRYRAGIPTIKRRSTRS